MSTAEYDNFLLHTEFAEHLYHRIASSLPIIDYHSHIDPLMLVKNESFLDMSSLWIIPDPYKHRAMRMNGVPERICTGQASDEERFTAWMDTLTNSIGNPLYHWSYLELKRYFEIDIYKGHIVIDTLRDKCNALLRHDSFLPRAILKRSNVEVLITSDDIISDPSDHIKITEDESYSVYPSMRVDRLLNLGSGEDKVFLKELSRVTGVKIIHPKDFRDAIETRIELFDKAGCTISDHALTQFCFFPFSEVEFDNLLVKIIADETLTKEDNIKYQSYLMQLLGRTYAKFEWTMMLHLGAVRNTSQRLKTLAGPFGGFATIGSSIQIEDIIRYLNELEKTNSLPKIILFNSNPSDNSMIATLSGSFTQDGVRGKVQFGPAWWYNDHELGIRNHILIYASHALLNLYIGMTTDSRSLLSFVRHEYFRRILCDILGAWYERGELSRDETAIEDLVKNICYRNPKNLVIHGRALNKNA